MTLMPGTSGGYDTRSRSRSFSSPLTNPAQYTSTLTHHLRRRRPSQVQTSFSSQPTLPSAGIVSITPSSATSTSLHESPIMTPETTGITTRASSMQVSPDIHASTETEPFPPPTPLVLPESVLSRKISSNSLAQHNVFGSYMPTSESAPKEKTNFIRRFSTKRKTGRTRRQSSVTPKGRDDSVGPAIIRRRSDSNNTVPPDFAPNPNLSSDSEDDIDRIGTFPFVNASGFDSPLRREGFRSTSVSIGGSSTSLKFNGGLIVPPSLTQGTFVTKVKSKKQKRLALTLDLDNAKIFWDKKFIDVDHMREIRTGSDTSQSRLDCGIAETDKDKFFSIIYDQSGTKAKKKMLHLLCDDVETQKNWTETLNQMTKHRYGQMASLSAFDDNAVKDYWHREMVKKFGEEIAPGSGEIDFDGVESLCKYLHIWTSPSQLRAKFYVADQREQGKLNYSEFLTFIGYMKRRDDMATIYRVLAKNDPKGLTLDAFLDFLRDTQEEDVDSNRQHWTRVFEKYTRNSTLKDAELASEERDRCMSEAQLANYLASMENSPTHPVPQEYELDRPINEYFISSSHNTYLLGRQFASQSSVEGYIAALVRGCRCVEVDCWDGSDGLPIVKHGYALTTHISFKEVMNTINKYAFKESQFPLWISLEVHCNPTQQEMMAAMIRETFGTKLVTEPLDPNSDQLPTPSQLLGRILIKVKKPGETQGSKESTGRRRGNSLNSPPVSSPFVRPMGSENSFAASFPNSPMLSPVPSARSISARKVKAIAEGEVQDGLSGGSDSEGYIEGATQQKKGPSIKIVKNLGELGVYNQGIKFNHSLDGPDSKKPSHIYSLMEGTFNKFCERSKENKQAVFRHNMRYFMRVYPDQLRVKSDNFDPLIYWRRGVQMCALNWQTFDLPMQLNEAMFAGGTDRSGYVLKPQELREIQRVEQGVSKELRSKRPRKQVRFTIEVISAQQLTSTANLPANKSLDPYVEVEIYHANDKRDKKEDRSSVMAPLENLRACTDVAQCNGFNPVFNRKFEFVVTTKYPDLIFVRWAVRLSPDGERPGPISDRSPPLAVYTAKLLSLNKGYRTLPLYNQNGDRYLFSTLFCRTTVNTEDISQVYLPCREGNSEPTGNVLKSIGRSIFSRTSTFSKSVDGNS
ncbi:phosphatidylinositol-specific phospholipase c [Zalerion maritima]|uniref:Phosphoinositide phospholipase C n=1 Tax=Zalerion maritima TaxID=339359 RepID=A0AAD5RR24_9PEZI|nr:phosphatidylinositol-specific phospholipase c [Zalerion maritima]